MEIIVTQKGITHYQAMCANCNFIEADHTDPEYVRQLVYKHIRKTGHKVIIEKGVATHYEAAQRFCARSQRVAQTVGRFVAQGESLGNNSNSNRQ